MALPSLPLQGENPWYSKRTAWDTAVDGELTALDGRVDSVESDLTTRLSTATLDSRYVRIDPLAPVAVFFGSSNVLPATWTTEFCTMMGYTQKNYAVGGGSFTGGGAGAFSAQIAAAAADGSLNKATVKFVFLADAGNDMRSQTTNAIFLASANPTLSTLRSTFPNARIIIIPALWGITPGVTLGNLETGAIRALTQFSQTLKDLALVYNMDFVENSHLWHYDSTAWMKPGEVHFTSAGYTRIAQMMREFMRVGYAPVMSIGTGPVTAKPNVDSSNILVSREGNNIRITGSFNPSVGLGNDTDLFQMPEGVFPYSTMQIPIMDSTSRNVPAVATVTGAGNSRGLVRCFGPLTASRGYYVYSVLPAF